MNRIVLAFHQVSGSTSIVLSMDDNFVQHGHVHVHVCVSLYAVIQDYGCLHVCHVGSMYICEFRLPLLYARAHNVSGRVGTPQLTNQETETHGRHTLVTMTITKVITLTTMTSIQRKLSRQIVRS